MLWNIMMHGLMGWLGAYYFTLTADGIGMAILVVCVTQAVDQIRLKKEAWSEVDALPPEEQQEARQQLETTINKKLAMAFAQGVVLYSAIVLIIGQMARLHGWI